MSAVNRDGHTSVRAPMDVSDSNAADNVVSAAAAAAAEARQKPALYSIIAL